MIAFDPAWFNKIQINTREAGPGKLGIHVFKSGHACRYFALDEWAIRSPDFYKTLHELAESAWNTPDPLGSPCPNCGNDQHAWTRRYQGKTFCGFCGHNYAE
jgi:hypothetical protein